MLKDITLLKEASESRLEMLVCHTSVYYYIRVLSSQGVMVERSKKSYGFSN